MANLEDVITGMVVINHAKKIKDYCKAKKQCKECVFFCGVCSIGTFHPCDWDFRNLEPLGDKNVDV